MFQARAPPACRTHPQHNAQPLRIHMLACVGVPVVQVCPPSRKAAVRGAGTSILQHAGQRNACSFNSAWPRPRSQSRTPSQQPVSHRCRPCLPQHTVVDTNGTTFFVYHKVFHWSKGGESLCTLITAKGQMGRAGDMRPAAPAGCQQAATEKGAVLSERHGSVPCLQHHTACGGLHFPKWRPPTNTEQVGALQHGSMDVMLLMLLPAPAMRSERYMSPVTQLLQPTTRVRDHAALLHSAALPCINWARHVTHTLQPLCARSLADGSLCQKLAQMGQRSSLPKWHSSGGVEATLPTCNSLCAPCSPASTRGHPCAPVPHKHLYRAAMPTHRL
jgi:hypothetical protein